ncbi:hypothetical protein Ccrd_015914 [Cynara cardunculus var. scolymus]|uniref:Uncharacterized protein n=1 Tax=Cynara cardunculus var. scolymus TaxID=59895 RepID=A0A118K3C3_CYNCS|nr:hypothetical protein Ccrd_015914 [Cynara cardunculus var. scolymus]
MNRRSGGGSCIAIRTVPSISSRFYHVSASFSDPTTCGAPTWMRKGLPCVCFKGKGNYARICMNEERLGRLKNRTKIYFDANRIEHQGSWIHLLGEPTLFCKDILRKISFQQLLRKQGARGAAWEYPFAVAGDVLKSTRMQLEKELLLDDVLRIEDMPSFRLLY